MVIRTRDQERRTRRRIGWAAAALLATLIVLALGATFSSWSGDLTPERAREIAETVAHGWRGAVLNPNYWLFVGALVLLERLLPARPGVGALSVGGGQDLVWIVGAPIVGLTVVTLYSAILDSVYVHELGGVTLGLATVIGTTATVMFAFVVSDFLMWFTHLVRHKVPTFWHFHAVHFRRRP